MIIDTSKGWIMYKLIATSVTFFGAWNVISSGFHIFRSMSEMKENNFQLVYPMYPMQYYKLVTPKLVLLLVLTIHIKNTKPLFWFKESKPCHFLLPLLRTVICRSCCCCYFFSLFSNLAKFATNKVLLLFCLMNLKYRTHSTAL